MLFAIPSASFGCITGNAMLHQTFLFLGQLWQLFEVSQSLEFLRYAVCGIGYFNLWCFNPIALRVYNGLLILFSVLKILTS